MLLAVCCVLMCVRCSLFGDRYSVFVVCVSVFFVCRCFVVVLRCRFVVVSHSVVSLRGIIILLVFFPRTSSYCSCFVFVLLFWCFWCCLVFGVWCSVFGVRCSAFRVGCFFVRCVLLVACWLLCCLLCDVYGLLVVSC